MVLSTAPGGKQAEALSISGLGVDYLSWFLSLEHTHLPLTRCVTLNKSLATLYSVIEARRKMLLMSLLSLCITFTSQELFLI